MDVSGWDERGGRGNEKRGQCTDNLKAESPAAMKMALVVRADFEGY